VSGGFGDYFDWWTRVPPASFARRLWLSLLVGGGVFLAVSQSLFYQMTIPIPYKLIPDLRPVLLVGSPFLLGVWASWGSAVRRVVLLWFTLLLVFASAIDLASIQWVITLETPLAGDRIGFLRVAGMTAAIAGCLLLHADTAAVELRHALLLRGAVRADADKAHALLWGGALRRVGMLSAAALALGGALRVADLLWGNAQWGSQTAALVAGLALLLGGAYVLVRGSSQQQKRAP